MARPDSFFATQIYRARLPMRMNAELEQACLVLARDDKAGQRWAKAHGYRGYTSYASLNDLPERMPEFAALARAIDGHVAAFARALDFDLAGRRLKLDSLWANVMPGGGMHGAHIHPHSAISGTYYVSVPRDASAIKFEDPRLPLMMAAPVRKANAKAANRTFVTMQPTPGTLLLWESWLRHEVPLNLAKGQRISISFNYS
ncbi:MAG: hypothetical protein ISS15_14165 [Alphaproteobacteria bacterium]|nr:hypothetical protein [Alphaproteobacteria bacterium]MBL7098799.1 hypothetical protein [Alphaproteobacteria bacterium]